jgi:hypothetical protein
MASFCIRGAALLLLMAMASAPAAAQTAAAARTIPRTAEGRPNLQGVWQVRNRAAVDLEAHMARPGMPAGLSVVEGGTIPYQPWAAEKKRENFANRATADPLGKCHMAGVPRVMYIDSPFQIFQGRDAIALAFEWNIHYRLIHTNGSRHVDGIQFFFGDSRGRWEGDTLVVDVANHNDRTWLDMAGNFHSDALRVVERYTMLDADTIQYQATLEDPKVFTRPWTITMPFHRQRDQPRVLEYNCQAEKSEANGDFERQPRTWYMPGQTPAAAAPAAAPRPATAPRPANAPDLSGFYQADHGGGNWGIEFHAPRPGIPPGRGILIEGRDAVLPYQPWGRAERESRDTIGRGYDDPTAHCFVSAGLPRSFYVPSPFHILQTPTHVVFLHERMAWRIVSLENRPFLPDTIRLWNGDSIGHWEGTTLVVESRNFNGRAWLNEVGDVVSHAQTVVERFIPVDAKTVRYEATVTDPLVYTRPWTIAIPLNRQPDELLEAACLEDNQDLQNLKDVRDAERKRLGITGGPQ